MDEAGIEIGAEPVVRRGLAWPIWVLGLIGALSAIVYVFVIAAA
jgi:hypothetical protein